MTNKHEATCLKQEDKHDACTCERRRVACDRDCGALRKPETLEEYREALEHSQFHGLYGGCSHGN